MWIIDPLPIHAGGLRYHGIAPTLSILNNEKKETRAYDQLEIFEATKFFAKTEGIVQAPEPSHTVKGVIDEVLNCTKTR